jgi:hypothetical protein
MHPLVRVVGKMLRLIGISSPEDSIPKTAAASDPPSWRTRNLPEDERKDIVP